MTTWSRGICETNGIRLHYTRTGGEKPPLVLLHGLMGSGACGAPLARALEADFDVVMPDARGHGGSSAPLAGYRYDDHANDVIGLVRGLHLTRPVLLGHSMGGMAAAVVASRREVGLRGLVLVDPTFLSPERQREVFDSDVAEQHRRALASTKSDLVAHARARHPQRPLELVELQAEARLATSLRAFDVLTPPNPDHREVVRAIDVPTLLVIGDDPVVTLVMAGELTELNGRVRVEQIEKAGHGLPFDRPARLAEVVVAFLRTLLWCAALVLATSCRAATTATPTVITADSTTVPIASASSNPIVASSSTTVTPCSPTEDVRFGSTCCRRTATKGEPRMPGATVLDCRGPQVGQPCARKTDCDVVCACPGQGGRLSNMDGPSGPADGTTGIIGTCGGIVQVGVWRCEIDEAGKVTHVIID